MLTKKFTFFQNLEHYEHKSLFLGSFSNLSRDFLFWTFINVQNEKPKIEFTFYLLPEKRHANT